jgi:predicted lipoprotein with Yx(FWY)xxD motif
MRRLALSVAMALVLVGVGAATASTTSSATLQAHSSRYGKILFDGRGRVLYLFARDRGSRSTCYGACAKAWPPFLTSAPPNALAGVKARLLGTTKRRDGTRQVTYAGHPLYYFSEDTRPGQIKCQNVSNFGGLWLVVAPNGRAVR